MYVSAYPIPRREAPAPNTGHLRSSAMLAVFVILTFLAPLLSAGMDMSAWYAELRKPSWAPPQGVFGPVWTVLYLMMGVAAWGVWQRAGWSRALIPWAIQLVLNAIWTPIFFGLRQPGWAFLDMVGLWLAIGATMNAFARVKPWTAWMLAPYLAWVTFAAFLNFTIWRMNP
jgi:tryptophan-rich sensory protein